VAGSWIRSSQMVSMSVKSTRFVASSSVGVSRMESLWFAPLMPSRNSNGPVDHRPWSMPPALRVSRCSAVEIVSGAEVSRRLGVSREAVRLGRCRPRFPGPVGRVGQAVAWDWDDVRRWAEKRTTQASDRWGARRG